MKENLADVEICNFDISTNIMMKEIRLKWAGHEDMRNYRKGSLERLIFRKSTNCRVYIIRNYFNQIEILYRHSLSNFP
jgi:hypothetical protein